MRGPQWCGGGQYELPPGPSEEQPGEDQRAGLVQRETGETGERETRQWWLHPQLSQLRRTSALEIFQCPAWLEEGRGEHLLRSDQPGQLQVSQSGLSRESREH